jgi:DNA-binding NtrC family response regulator
MTLYGPLTAQNFLDLFKTVTRGGHKRAVMEEILDALIRTVESERGFLLELGDGASPRVLAARNHEGRSLARTLEAISVHALQKAIRSPKRWHLSSRTLEDRRHLTDESRRGGRRPRAILAVLIPLEPSPGRERIWGAAYLDHRFKEIEVNEHRLLSMEHWCVLLELVFRLRRGERLLRRRDQQIEKLEASAAAAPGDEPPAPPEPQAPLEAVEFHGFWTASEPMKRVIEVLQRIAASDLAVLITGETGAGKGLLARAVHRSSRRAERPFLSVNCGALPEALLESELFGHLRGAFTGADLDHQGLIEQAEGGTLFLDEIGDMSAAMQKKLLRFLEDGRYRPLGGREEKQADVRLVSATRLSLAAEVEAGRFRSDLFYRLCGLQLEVPPLRQRRQDILPLAEGLLAAHARDLGLPVPPLDAGAQNWLLAHLWPGNVRELENLMRQVLVLAPPAVDRAALARIFRKQASVARGAALEIDGVVAAAEERAIRKALGECAGNKSQAAALLGITRKSLYRRLAKYGLLEGARDERWSDSTGGRR